MTVRPDTTAYGPELSAVYDLVYQGRGKDFGREAGVVTRAILAAHPRAASLLDVACGTGEHLRAFQADFAHVAGLELSPQMCEVARVKLPGVEVYEADMRAFALDRRYDAVCCLFSSIGYMSSAAELDAAIGCMANHLVPGGALVVDPWWFPERFLDGYVSDAVVRDGDRLVVRMAQSVRTGDVVRQEAHYLLASPAGIEHFINVQRITLFTRDQYESAFRRASCAVRYLEGDEDVALSGRGLFVGVRQ